MSVRACSSSSTTGRGTGALACARPSSSSAPRCCTCWRSGRARHADRRTGRPRKPSAASTTSTTSRPALLVAAAVQTGVGESSYPASAGSSGRVFLGDDGHPGHPGRRSCDGDLLFIADPDRLAGSARLLPGAARVRRAGGPAGVLMAPLVACSPGWPARRRCWRSAPGCEDEGGAFNVLFRFVLIPMTLFSGSFFPIDQMPLAISWMAWISPLWHGNELARGAALGGSALWPAVGHSAYLLALLAVGAGRRPPVLPREADRVSARTDHGVDRAAAPAVAVACCACSRCSCRGPVLGGAGAEPAGLPAVLDGHRLGVLRAGVLPVRARSGSVRWSAPSTPGPAGQLRGLHRARLCWPPRR